MDNRAGAIKTILDAHGVKGGARSKMKARLEALSDTDLWEMFVNLDPELIAARKKAGVRASRPFPQKFKPRKSRRSSRKSGKIGKATKKRVSRISRAIKSGKLKAKNGIKSPADIKAPKGKRLSAKQRAEKFVKTYKGARPSRKSRASKKK